jgi:hypothetical protein
MTEDGKLRIIEDPELNVTPVVHSFTADEISRAKKIPRVTAQSCGVYLLKSSTNLFKIGCTHHLSRRMSDFWNVIPEDVEIFAFAPTKEHRASERYLHAQYQARRIKGEWFALTQEDIADLLDKYDFIIVGKTISQFLGECLPKQTDV